MLLNALIYPGIKTNSQKNSIVAIFHTAVIHFAVAYMNSLEFFIVLGYLTTLDLVIFVLLSWIVDCEEQSYS